MQASPHDPISPSSCGDSPCATRLRCRDQTPALVTPSPVIGLDHDDTLLDQTLIYSNQPASPSSQVATATISLRDHTPVQCCLCLELPWTS
ncbi:hypothetical protein CDL15_Pgr014011 [Punica granatum]|uniref:Uncharacterized protein n=1 Tax=Punica granatum TaxID=22663 RepID=A0A218WB32_PUNGR|nr:hypothetical protein CDL15_Pgr014011 [Punica granatum]